MRPQPQPPPLAARPALRVGVAEGGVRPRHHRGVARPERRARPLRPEEQHRVLAYGDAALAHHGKGEDHDTAPGVIDDGAARRVPQLGVPARRAALIQPLPAVVVGERAQGLDRDRQRRQDGADAAQDVEAFGQEQEQERQDVRHHPRAPALPAVPFAPAADQDPVADGRRGERRHQPALSAPEGPHHAGDRHRHHGREDEKALGRRHEQARVSHAPGLVESAAAAREAVPPGRVEVDPLIEEDEGHHRRRPQQKARDLAGPPHGDSRRQRGREDDVGVARRDGEGQRQARAAGPRGVLARPNEAEHGQREEEDGRGVLPQRLASGPDARPQGEDGRREHGLLDGAPAAHGQEQDARGQTGEKRRRQLPEDRGARLVEGEKRPCRNEERSREHRGQDRIDRDPVLPHRSGERVLDLGVLVEVEVGLLGEAGRHALRGPGVARSDGPAVREQQHEQAQRDRGGGEQRRPHDPRRSLERLFPGADAHQRGGTLDGLGAPLAPALALGDGGGAPRFRW